MRKVYYLIIALLATTIACSSEKKQEEAVTEEMRIDSFASPDLTYAHLRGPVQKCIVTTTDAVIDSGKYVTAEDPVVSTKTQVFDKNGRILQVTSEDSFGGEPQESLSYIFEYDTDGNLQRAYTSNDGSLRVHRGEDGKISIFSLHSSTGAIEFKTGYTWDGNLLTEEHLINTDKVKDADDDVLNLARIKNSTVYTYDDNQELIGSTEENGDPMREITVVETKYTNTEFDSHGNWTKRTVSKKGTTTMKDDLGKSETITLDPTYFIETRTITYF